MQGLVDFDSQVGVQEVHQKVVRGESLSDCIQGTHIEQLIVVLVASILVDIGFASL